LQSRFPGFDVEEAYEVAARLREKRAVRGERAIGRKIGFTNPAVQKAFGVSAPIWNSMFDTTVLDIAAMEGFALSGLPEPLIEPEIAFHLAAAPRADMGEEELFACVDWVAHGCEIVQSIFPNWRFTAADSIAAYGLHGAYLIGEKRPIADNRREWEGRAFRLHPRAFARGRGRPTRAREQRARRAAQGVAVSRRGARFVAVARAARGWRDRDDRNADRCDARRPRRDVVDSARRNSLARRPGAFRVGAQSAFSVTPARALAEALPCARGTSAAAQPGSTLQF
jgi:2-keto-4-pentenoate hydratase